MTMTLPTITDSRSLHLLLTTETPQEIRTIHSLWDTYSGLPGLLDGEGWSYDSNSGQYIDSRTKHPVSDSTIRSAVKKVSQEAANQMRKNSQQFLAGIIILMVWESRMRDLMSALYKTVFLVAIGGFLFENDITRNLFYLLVVSHFGYLDEFASEISTLQEDMTAGTFFNRSGMYGLQGNAIYQNAILQMIMQGEMIRRGLLPKRVRRILGANENHCHDSSNRSGCIELAQEGWVPLAAMVPIGEASCFSNCLCHLEYS